MSSILATSLAWRVHPLAPSHDEYSRTILQNLILEEIKTPTPGLGCVLVRMRATALNFRDLLVLADSPNYPIHTPAGLIPCSDGAGEVVALGDKNSNSGWRVGDKVILMPNRWMGGGPENFVMEKALGAGEMEGTLSQYRVVPEEWLVGMPAGLTFEEGASLPTAGGTAVQALFHGGVTEAGSLDLTGRTVLVQGTGGVSVFALQLASKAGARVVVTSSSDKKLELAKRLGASEVINYKTTPDWAEEVLRVTDGKGVDLVVEVGGAGTIQQSLKASRFGGTIVVIGILTSSKQADILPDILFGAKKVRGHLGLSKVMLKELVTLIEEHDISPVVGKTFEWEEAPKAFEYMMAQNTVGKIVIRIGG